MVTMSPDINIMVAAAEKASRTLLRDFGEVEQLQVSKKGPADFVSAADRRAEDILHAELSKARPDYGFIMEESGSIKGDKEAPIFVIDPLDGTHNFLHGLPHWCISIAIVEHGKPKAGIVYAPLLDELFHAERGEGAFIGKKRLRVSGRNNLEGSMIGGSSVTSPRRTTKKDLRQVEILLKARADFRCLGAVALDLSYVAAGRLDGLWTGGISIWDIAAGLLIVEEAKGSISSLDPNKPDPLTSPAILVSNGYLHKDLDALLSHVKE